LLLRLPYWIEPVFDVAAMGYGSCFAHG